MKLRTLVLNADLSPISLFPLHTIPAEDAVTRVINDTCYVVAEYNRRILTPRVEMYWPAIIARREFARPAKYAALRRETLFYRDHAVCAYCGVGLTVDEVTVDHVTPQSRGGQTKWDNVVAACRNCNAAKGDSPPIGQWKPHRTPYTPTYWNLLSARRKFPITIDHESWMDFIHPWEGEIKIREVLSDSAERIEG